MGAPLSFTSLLVWSWQTFSSQPTIPFNSLWGAPSFVPSATSALCVSTSLLCFAMAAVKWKAPIKLPMSVIATPGILHFAAISTSSFTLIVLCNMLNDEWTCRWLKADSIPCASEAEGIVVAVSFLLDRLSTVVKMALACSARCSIISSAKGVLSEITPSLASLKKQRAVASTSAAALCASSKGRSNSLLCSSERVGHLNFPPFPPGRAQ